MQPITQKERWTKKISTVFNPPQKQTINKKGSAADIRLLWLAGNGYGDIINL